MWNLLKKHREECGQFREVLEAAAGAAPPAETREALLLALPAQMQSHAASCQECLAAAEGLLSVRALLRGLPAQAATREAWFAPRVMAAIAAQEAEVRRAGTSWAAVPKLASRLALASAALLLVVSAWIYKRPDTAPPGVSAADTAQETLFETSPPPANQDDMLISLAERPQ